MEAGNCSLQAEGLSLGNLSGSCVLPGTAAAGGALEVEVGSARWLVSYVYELSCSELRLPGTPLALYLGSWAAIFELVAIMLIGRVVLLASGYLAYRLRSSSWLAPAARASMFVATGVGLLLLPFVVLAVCGRMRSVYANFALALLSILGFFRTYELAMGSGPKGCDHSARSSGIYCGAIVEVLFDDDGRALAAPKGRRWRLFCSVLGHGLAMLLSLGAGHATEWTPFLGLNVDILAMPAMGLPLSLPALWLQAVFVYLNLALTMDGISFIAAVFGVETHTSFRHPLFLSTSVRDFWGRRWNILIHRMMHRSFFTPVAGRIGPRAGAIAAFSASALFHEYMWCVVNYEVEGYLPGGPLAFFAAQFALLTGEALLRRTKLGCAARALPAPALTLLATLAILPFGPLFLVGLQRGGLMADAVRIFPHPRLAAM